MDEHDFLDDAVDFSDPGSAEPDFAGADLPTSAFGHDPATEPPVADDALDDGRAVDAGLLDELEGAVKDVERALARLDDGTYGTCEACGTTLTQAELHDDPTVRFCTAHLPLRVN